MSVIDRARRRSTAALWVAALASLATPPRGARANGAFPDSQSILTPAARPREIALITNFGAVLSEDDGQSWLWSCEQAANSLGYLYQYGPPPRNRMFALAGDNLVFSDDVTCGWQVATGLATERGLNDFFPDPSNPDRVLAAAFDYVTTTSSVLASSDGGATFTATLYTTAKTDGISGVEIARSDPRTVYLTTSITATSAAVLMRSTDGGASWLGTDLTTALGTGVARIIAVDPEDPARVLLLFKSATAQSVALTRDGGKTVTRVLAAPGYFTSYARTANGTILIGGTDGSANPNPVLFASHDGGLTFAPIPGQPPHIRALATRGPNLYAATDNFGDGYALGVSTDEGATWRPLMSYDRMTAIVGCLKDTCRALCEQEVLMGLWSEPTCTADAPVTAADAGADGGGGGGAGGGGAGAGADAGDARDAAHATPGGGGHGCAVTPDPIRGGADLVTALPWCALLASWRRRQRGRAGHTRRYAGRRSRT